MSDLPHCYVKITTTITDKDGARQISETLTPEVFRPRAPDYLDGQSAPNAPSTGHGRLAKVYRAPRSYPTPGDGR